MDGCARQGPSKLEDAVQYCEQALSLDRYNASALVNRGNIFFVLGDIEKAAQYYKEALSNEVSAFHTEKLGFTWHTIFTLIASCVQALYNLGYVYRLQGKLEAALECFYKLQNILLNNVEVLCQLAAM
ncbi:unnamed protein product [Gongylonema pulchrum]|uniref:TPR_REGION domain-containing protein n=1 Tax=Gongylonema pulchrum TaxID=637853 RepID=A0A183EKD8_9BILA|nr:unnamed protein product [Gongylonema pulchrum]